MAQVIDCHVHYHGSEGELERLLRTCDQLGIDRAVIFGGDSNAAVLDAARSQPDRLVPFARFALGTDSPERVEEFADAGFRGIKFIYPRRAYNDEEYMPVYARMAERGLVALFHLGIVARPRDGRPDDNDSNHARPVQLDHIARRHPALKVIGAHLGNPWYEEATMSARWNENLWFDLSGSTLKKKTPQFLRSLLWWDKPGHPYRGHGDKHPFEKIVFGTDVAHEWMPDVYQDYQLAMEGMGVPPEYREKIMGGTAMEILGIEP
ncbi:MAG: amidohydrolase family protein [Candidatus Brocadiia bacterium]